MSGIFGSSQWMYASGGFYNGVATQSLRFDDGSSAYLTRTPSSASNRKTWTWSAWVKLSALGADRTIFGAGTDGDNQTALIFLDTNKLLFNNEISNSRFMIQTDAVFRDVSSWYHVVLAVDTTQSTNTDRVNIYINGEIQTLSSVVSGYPNQNVDTFVNATNANAIGASSWISSNYNDGYMAEINFVDGSQLDPTSFGETKNGVWIPKAYTGSYGTNGFRLQFNQTGTGSASSSTIGADTSGNDNHFSSSGIVASDCDMPDSPENNFCTLNPLIVTASATNSYAEGNLQGGTSSTGGGNITGTMAIPSEGKWYYEFRSTTIGSGINLGLWETNATEDFFYQVTPSIAYLSSSGEKRVNNSTTSYGATWNSSNTMGVAVDIDGGTVTFYKDNVSQGAITFDASGLLPVFGDNTGGSGCTARINFGADSTFAGEISAGGNADANGNGDFAYAPPSGFLALCTANLPEPTISPNADTQADDYFNTVLYTGTGSSGQAITGVNFQPDWLWIKKRSGASSHNVFDSVRGVAKRLITNGTSAEDEPNQITSFDTDGFTINSGNDSGATYVSWNWKAGGTAVSNTDGTITSSVSANTDAGFSIVSYTGNSTAGATIGHGLGAVVRMVIIKNREQTDNWAVGHTDIGFSNHLQLNVSDASTSANAVFNSTAPTSTVFSVGTNHKTNASSEDYIAYCFAEVEGYSKFGSYTGNGSADGTFVYTGFRPAWIMMKDTSEANSWAIYDVKRNTFNLVDSLLQAHDSASEATYGGIDYTANGFKFRSSVNALNKSSNNYIYMAFAENPFKYANAR